MTTIALFGAGGTMGFKAVEKLISPEYRMLYVEVSKAGVDLLARHGIAVTPQDQAVREADVVVLAVPDALIGKIAHAVVPDMKRGAMLMAVDAAAAYAGEFPESSDIAYFLTHPCHQPVGIDETDPEARKDFFGGIKAKQHIVCSLMQGKESNYALGESIARDMFAPVMKAHRVTVDQMAMLEPALAETIGATCIVAIREAMDEAIRRGLPEEVARDFLLGHINVSIGFEFGFIEGDFSEGCKIAIERGKKLIFQPEWMKVLETENRIAEIKAITRASSDG